MTAPPSHPPAPGSRTLKIKTPPFSHHGIAFSPYFDGRIAVASGANFGLVGNGRLHVLQLGPQGLGIFKTFDTQDCVFDVAWSESHENQVVAACGNGGLRLFDISLDRLPVKAWNEHGAEIVHVEWNNLQKDTFVTASWDQTVKVFSVDRTTSLLSIPAHPCQIFCAAWSPHTPSMLATCAADGMLKIFDVRSRDPSKPIQEYRASPGEVLACDWNKYDISTIATGGKDQAVRIWDLRAGRADSVTDLRGHQLAVRKVQWSPHDRDALASTSYDMSCRIWSVKSSAARSVNDQHTEFCMGVAWALFDPGLVGSCGWDQEVHLFRA